MSTAVNDIVDLSFRADLGLLFGRWLRTVNDAEVRLSYEAALAVAEPQRARYWLLDMRRRGLVSNAATRWVAESFLPKVVERLGGHLYLAYLLSPAHLSDATAATERTVALHSRCQAQLFTDEASALRWLNQCRKTGAPLPTSARTFAS